MCAPWPFGVPFGFTIAFSFDCVLNVRVGDRAGGVTDGDLTKMGFMSSLGISVLVAACFKASGGASRSESRWGGKRQSFGSHQQGVASCITQLPIAISKVRFHGTTALGRWRIGSNGRPTQKRDGRST